MVGHRLVAVAALDETRDLDGADGVGHSSHGRVADEAGSVESLS